MIDLLTDTKKCSKCKEVKSLDAFSNQKARAHLDGKSNYCKSCANSHAKNWNKDNAEACAEYQKDYRRNNQDKIRQYDKNRKVSNSERTSRYHKSNPFYFNRKHAERRALEKAATISVFNDEMLQARLAYYGYKCWICKVANYEHIDHVKPLSKGGAHMLGNLRPACADCNLKKSNKWPFNPKEVTK